MERRQGEHPYGDRGQMILLFLFLAIWAADSFFWHLSTFGSRFIPLWIRLAILGLSLAAALIIMQSGHSVIGPERKPVRVMTSGPFRYVRHPLYLAAGLTYFGLTAVTASLLSLAAMVVIFIFYNHIARFEERYMEKEFPDEYRDFMKNTGRWIPRIRKDR